MKRVVAIALLVVLVFSLACSGKKAYMKAVIPELKKAFATEGFETEVDVIKKGKVYDIRVDYKGLFKDNPKWENASAEKKLAWFARVCAEIVGVSLDESGYIDVGILYIAYAGQVWSVPIEFAGYISSHAISRSKSASQLEKELMEKLELVE
jgi:hypothetical protein